MTRPTTCRNSKIFFFGHGSYIILHQFGPISCSNSGRLGSCRRIVCVCFQIGFRLWSYFCEVWMGSHDLSSIEMTGGPLCGGAAFTGIVVFFNSGLLSFVTWWLYYGWIRAGFPVAVRLFTVGHLISFFVARAGIPLAAQVFFTEENALCFFSNKLLQIECLRGVLIETFDDELYPWEFGDSVSIVSRLQQNVVLPNPLSLYPRLNHRAHYPSMHIPIVNLDHCEVVYILCPRVLSLFFWLRVWSQSIGLCQLLLRNRLLVTLEVWCCCLCWLAFGLPKQLDLCGVSGSCGRL